METSTRSSSQYPPPLVGIVTAPRGQLGERRIPGGVEHGRIYWMEDGSAGLTWSRKRELERYSAEAEEMRAEALIELGVDPAAFPGNADGVQPQDGQPKVDLNIPVYALLDFGGIKAGTEVKGYTEAVLMDTFGTVRTKTGDAIPVTLDLSLVPVAKKPTSEVDPNLTPRAFDDLPTAVDIDLRILRPVFDGRGRRHLDFRAASDSMREPEHGDWPVEGPATSCYCVDFMSKFGGSALGFHNRWKAEGRLQLDDLGILEHESLAPVNGPRIWMRRLWRLWSLCSLRCLW